MHWMMVGNKHRFFAMAQEFELAPQQMIAIRMLGSGPRKMSELAQALYCDNSNVTGIVDRLEERGLVRREAAEGDRRVKLLVLTKEGERMRVEITKRMAEPPPPIASLSEKDQRQLRDILKRAVEGSRRPTPPQPFRGARPPPALESGRRASAPEWARRPPARRP